MNSVATVQSENVVFGIKQILTVCGNLAEAKRLPTETPIHI